MIQGHVELELQRLRERVFGFGETIEMDERLRQQLIRRGEIASEADSLVEWGECLFGLAD